MLSYLKKSRVALAAVGFGALLAGTTALSGTARADWDHGRGHGDHGRNWDRGDHGRGGHWDRGEHWRGGYYREHWRPHYRHYEPEYVYYPRAYYDDPYYYPAYDTYYPAGVSFGFNFR